VFLIYFFGLAQGFITGRQTLRASQLNTNTLLLGNIKPISSHLEIPVNSPANLSGLTRKQIYELRTRMVLQHPELVLGNYRPSESVFGAIVDEKPWWGIVGEFFNGPGKESIIGDSEESRFLLNPFLLASPEFMGLTFYGGGNLRWRSGIDENTLMAAKFPFYCFPQDLKWYPQAASAEVTYDVSKYLGQLNKYTDSPLVIGRDSNFELIAYNARDLGFNYVFIGESENITNDHGDLQAPVELRQFIHCGDSCGYPGGCNNMSPAVPETDDLRVTELPAKLKLLFWKDKPESKDERADMTYTINFN
jgi:hypothetical protein